MGFRRALERMITGVKLSSMGSMRACEATAGISRPDLPGICMAKISAWNFARSSSHSYDLGLAGRP
ncbi:unnamed protein product [Ectocarpus sp. 12 AP-2014]